MPVTCILLAAGSSSRLGRSKQLLLIHGAPLVLHAAQVAIASGAVRVVVVVPPGAAGILTALAGLPLETIENPDAAEGIASSIRCGVRSTTGPWLLTLCDQPRVTPGHLQALMSAGGSIAATQYPDGRAGVPALFAIPLREELLALRGDSGAQRVIGAHRDLVQLVPFGEAAIDIDTEEDLAQLK